MIGTRGQTGSAQTGQPGDIAQTVKTSLEAAQLAVSDINAVITSLNKARSVVVTVANNTSKDLILLSTEHSHGGFAPANPPGIIPKQTSAVFGSQSDDNSIGTGTEGSATYQVDRAITFTIRWDDPFIGDNSSDQSLAGPNHNQYRGISTTGKGDQKAPMRYDLFEIETHGHRVVGAILDKWAATGWSAGPLGFPTTDEAATSDPVGRFNEFEGGSIFWRPEPEVGAHEVHGAIHDRWNQIGREKFGYPVTDETATPDGIGRFNHFRRFAGPPGDSSIYWTPATGPHEVYGAIRDKWASMGWERSQLGYPIDAEADANGGRIQHFQHGAIFWTAQAGAVVQ